MLRRALMDRRPNASGSPHGDRRVTAVREALAALKLAQAPDAIIGHHTNNMPGWLAAPASVQFRDELHDGETPVQSPGHVLPSQ